MGSMSWTGSGRNRWIILVRLADLRKLVCKRDAAAKKMVEIGPVENVKPAMVRIQRPGAMVRANPVWQALIKPAAVRLLRRALAGPSAVRGCCRSDKLVVARANKCLLSR
jgi:hypothetical protein